MQKHKQKAYMIQSIESELELQSNVSEISFYYCQEGSEALVLYIYQLAVLVTIIGAPCFQCLLRLIDFKDLAPSICYGQQSSKTLILYIYKLSFSGTIIWNTLLLCFFNFSTTEAPPFLRHNRLEHFVSLAKQIISEDLNVIRRICPTWGGEQFTSLVGPNHCTTSNISLSVHQSNNLHPFFDVLYVYICRLVLSCRKMY